MLQLGRTVPCSWLKIRLRHGHRSCAGHSRTSKALSSGGACLNHSALFSHQTQFLDHDQVHNSHICLLQAFRHADGFTKDMGFLPWSCPHSTASHPPCGQYVPHSIFFSIGFFNPLKYLNGLPHLQACHNHGLWHRRAKSLCLPVSSRVLGFETSTMVCTY